MTHTITRPLVTWVLVADGKVAQIYTRKMVEKHIPLVGRGKHRHSKEVHEPELASLLAKPLTAESLDDYQVGRGQTAMVFESVGMARHMSQPRIDARREVKQHFAQRIASLLSKAKMGRAFDRLVLVAPPAMLGEIEARLDDNVRHKVIARLPKELAHLSSHDIMAHLNGIVY